RRVLGLDLSTANNRLLTTARDLRLDAVVTALRSVLSSLGVGRSTGASIDERSESGGRGPAGSAGGEGVHPRAIDKRSESGGRGPAGSAGGEGVHPRAIDELARLVAALDELNARLDALVREHDQWQAIGNDLRHFVDGGQPGLEETRHSWPPVQESLVAVLQAGAGADWTRVIDAAAKDLEGALGSDDPCKCVAQLRGLFRRANQRFVEVDKMLLRTCEELRQVGDTLDSVLKVIDEQ